MNDLDYINFVGRIKDEIRDSRQRAINKVNIEMIELYWRIGSLILESQGKNKWGSKIITSISNDIKSEFPTLKGFSKRNLEYMRKFALTYQELKFVQQVVAQISWSHNVVLLDRIKNENERLWYIDRIVENSWSRNVLIHQIESKIFERQQIVEKTTNFENTLNEQAGKMAVGVLKDPYIFDFISFEENMQEKDIEKELVRKISDFLLELGAGFAFLGNQYHLEVGKQDYYLDLLFYHVKLKSYVVIELKTGSFKPEYAGKMNFYLSAVDSILKSDDDNPTIGIILCKEKNRLVAEYALRDMSKPMGVSEYKLLEEIPSELKSSFPTIEEIEAKLTE